MAESKRFNGRHIGIVGTGIVGACCAAELTLQGARVTLIDRAQPGISGPSRGNAAHIAASEIIPMATPGIAFSALSMLLDNNAALKIPISQWLRLAPWLTRFMLNSRKAIHQQHTQQLATFNNTVISDVEQLFNNTNLADLLHRDGALYLYETKQSLQDSAAAFATRAAHGFESVALCPAEIYALEPQLAKVYAGGYHLPQWMTVSDPIKVVNGLVSFCIAQGAKFSCEEVQQFDWSQQSQLAAGGVQVTYKSGQQVRFDQVVLSAGIWSKPLLKQLGEKKLLTAERGYNLTYTAPGLNVSKAILFADRGIVATPLDHGIRIGGWAEFAGTERPPNPQYFRAINQIAQSLFPKLQTQEHYRWMGHRPSTPSSLPIIERSKVNPNIVFAMGHGHLGLTQGPTTAMQVADLLATG